MTQLLYFTTEWCTVCPQQDELLKDFDTVPVAKIDAEQNSELANQYSVRSVPTLVLLDEDENVIQQFSGLTQPSEITDALP